MSVDLRHFRSFVVVAEERNIGRAAERLFITQPALSRQIRQLEQELDVTLLIRLPRGVELTEAGRELLGKARVALEAAEQALTIGRPAEPSGPLAVGLSVAGQRDHWYGLAKDFAARHAAVDVEIRSALSEPLQRQVAAGELDVAIVLEPRPLPGLRYRALREETVEAWMHPDHPLAGREAVSPADVAAHPVTLVGGAAGRDSGFNAAVQRIFANAGREPEYVETPELIPIYGVRTPVAVTVSIDVGFDGDVRRLPLTGGHRMRYSVVHREEAGTAAVRAFAAFALRHAAAA